MEKDLGQVRKLLTSPDSEDVKLGLEICKKAYPFVYAALLDLKIPTTGLDSRPMITFNDAYSAIDKNLIDSGIGIGSQVRYVGIKDSPEMVVVRVEIEKTKSTLFNLMYVVLECKYFNKSKQEFFTVKDRLECFQLVNNK